MIVLYEVVDGAAKVLYPVQYAEHEGAVYNLAVNAVSTVADLQNAINHAEYGSTVRLTESLDLSGSSDPLTFRNSVTFDLGGNTLTLNGDAVGAVRVVPQENGYFVLKNGTIEEASDSTPYFDNFLLCVDGLLASEGKEDVYIKNVNVILENLTIITNTGTDSSSGSTCAIKFMYLQDSEVTLRNLTVTGTINILDCFESDFTIESGTYTANDPGANYCIYLNDGSCQSLTINGGTFYYKTDAVNVSEEYYTKNGGTFIKQQ